ncbi:radical SAM protein [Elusimicrobiota bacterium]
MITEIHFLLTYTCIMECDHCFLHCGPYAKGTFTVKQIERVIKEASRIKTLEWIYFEGGEAFLFYPTLLEGIRLARKKGFKVGIVSNCYWATSKSDARIWLKPLKKLGISDLSISEDDFHLDDKKDKRTKNAMLAAKKLGIPTGVICVEGPKRKNSGAALLRGRAADKLVKGLAKSKCSKFTQCLDEEIRDPKRVHIDPYGHVQICQGISIGNMWKKPLSSILENYDWRSHAICSKLAKGGPALLARKYHVKPEAKFASACHACYATRKSLIKKFPKYLAPKQVYGIK